MADPKSTPVNENTAKKRHASISTPDSENNKRTRMAANRAQADDELLKKITAHFDSSTNEFKNTFNKKFEEVNLRVSENSKDIQEIKSAIKRIEGQSPSPAPNPNAGPSSTRAVIDSQLDKRGERFEVCRRSLRFWPVNGRDEKELNVETWRFIRQKLQVPDDELGSKQIERIRRIRSAKQSKIKFEVSVLFTDVAARDRVSSHGRSLANYQNEDGTPSAGMRIEYPDHLGYSFRCLDWFGKDLKNRFGNGLRRNIRFNNDNQNLCMDVRFPDTDRWERISAQVAIDEKKAFDEENDTALRQRLRRPRQEGRPFGSEYSSWNGSQTQPENASLRRPRPLTGSTSAYKSPTKR